MGEQKKQRLLYIDILNILACLAVISLHHNGLVHSFEDTLAWRESPGSGVRPLLGGYRFF